MNIAAIIAALRSDTDDRQNLVTKYSDKDVSEFINRATKLVNEEVPMAKKYYYGIFSPMMNVYPLPSDYLAFSKRMVSYRDQTIMKYSEYNQDRNQNTLGAQTRPTMSFFIDESRRKIIFDFIPDISYGSTYARYLDGTAATVPYVVLSANAVYTFSQWYDPTILKETSNTGYIRNHRATRSITAFRDTATTNAMTTSAVINAGDTVIGITSVANLVTGDTIFIDGEERTIQSINTGPNTVVVTIPFSAHLTAQKVFRVGGSSTTLTEYRICYLSEVNINSDVYSASTSTYQICDYGLEYFFEPADIIAQATGKIYVTGAGGTTASVVSGVDAEILSGYGVYIEGYGMRKATSNCSAGSFTIDFAYDATAGVGSAGAAYAFWVIKLSAVPPISYDTHSMIVEMARYLAVLKSGNMQLAENIYQGVKDKFKNMNEEQVKDAVNKVNATRGGDKWNYEYDSIDSYGKGVY